ncbi:hypothetical protein, partial [Peribacillus frigoritolerans]|uniref:hypothetical protein n=1 Tax=Peribacillus frigoritolerans TaxID=450367 RepID=UPI002E24DB0B|nr:hypothetical protein [Peribacillus frigoritolerans]
FFHPLRNTVKKHEGSPILKLGSGCVQPTGFLKITFLLIPEIRSLSADCIPKPPQRKPPVGSRLASYSAGVSLISSIH